jgi:hypothetical protein
MLDPIAPDEQHANDEIDSNVEKGQPLAWSSGLVQSRGLREGGLADVWTPQANSACGHGAMIGVADS